MRRRERWWRRKISSLIPVIHSQIPSAKAMSVKCRGLVWICSMISLLTQLLLTLASASFNIHVPNYYDGDPIFHEGFSPSLSSSSSGASYPEEDGPIDGSSLMSLEPMDITADTRFNDLGAAWELKINKDSPPASLTNSKKSSKMSTPNSKPKRTRGPSRTHCGTGVNQFHEPPLSAQNLIGQTLKRSDVATTGLELKEKLRREKILKEDQKKVKKNHPETYWACETTFVWTNLGSDYYPRHVRTASCNSNRCANNRYECIPRTYTLQILKRFAVSDSTTFLQDNNLLPPELRTDWRLVDHEIIHCCECSSRPLTLGK